MTAMSPVVDPDYATEPASSELIYLFEGLIDATNGIIAGGVFKDIKPSLSSGEPSLNRAKDIDIYLRTTEDYDAAYDYMRTMSGKPIYETQRSSGFSYGRNYVLDLVKQPYPDAISVLKTFDFTVTKKAMFKDDNGELMIMKHPDFDQHLLKKEIHYSADHVPAGHHNPLERLCRYSKVYGYKPSMDTLVSALEYKVRNSYWLRQFTVQELLQAAEMLTVEIEGDTVGHTMSRPPLNAEQVLLALTYHAYMKPKPSYQGSLNNSNRYQELDFERSIYQTVKHGASTENLSLNYQGDLEYAEQVLEVKLLNSENFAVAPNAVQMSFIEYLTDLDLTPEESTPIIQAVFGTLGFLSKHGKHGIYCPDQKYAKGSFTALTHHCNHPKRSSFGNWNTKQDNNSLKPDLRRDEEVEIMWRLLTMEDTAEWRQKVSAFFAEMVSNEFRMHFMTFFEWLEAIDQGVFTADIPYDLLYQLVSEDD